MSQTNIQFSVASHLMAALAYYYGEPQTSTVLAQSVRADASFVRRTLARLSKAGLILTTRGKNGSCELARKPTKISLLEIYRASEAPPTFAIHTYPVEPLCPISINIKDVMGGVLDKAQIEFEKSLAKLTLADVVTDIKSNTPRS